MSITIGHAAAGTPIRQRHLAGNEVGAGGVVHEIAELVDLVDLVDLGEVIQIGHSARNPGPCGESVRADIAQLASPRRRRSVTEADRRQASLTALMEILIKIAPETQREAVGAALERLEKFRQSQRENVQGYQQSVESVEAALAQFDVWRMQFDASRQALDAATRQASGEHVGALQREVTELALRGRRMLRELLQLQVAGNAFVVVAEQSHALLPGELIQREQSSIGRLLVLLGSVAQIIKTSTEDRIEADHEMLRTQQQMRLDMLVKLTEEAGKAQQHSAAINGTMGIIGKILGAGLLIVGVAGAIFTGGVILMLALAGIGLIIADETVRVITGESVIEKGLESVMKSIQPVFDTLVHAAASVLEHFGVDSSTALLVGSALVAIIFTGAVLVLALTGVGGSLARGAASMLGAIGRALVRPIEILLTRLLPQLAKDKLKHVASLIANDYARIIQALARRMGASENAVTRQIQAQRLNQAAAAFAGLHVVSTGVMTVGEGAFQFEHARKMASMKLIESELDLIGEMMADVLSQLQTGFDLSQELYVQVAGMIQQRATTGAAMTQGIRSAIRA